MSNPPANPKEVASVPEAVGTFACPICDHDYPHDHSLEERAWATRPDGSWRRHMPRHPYEGFWRDGVWVGLEPISISMPRSEVEKRKAYNAQLMQEYEAALEEWRKNG